MRRLGSRGRSCHERELKLNIAHRLCASFCSSLSHHSSYFFFPFVKRDMHPFTAAHRQLPAPSPHHINPPKAQVSSRTRTVAKVFLQNPDQPHQRPQSLSELPGFLRAFLKPYTASTIHQIRFTFAPKMCKLRYRKWPCHHNEFIRREQCFAPGVKTAKGPRVLQCSHISQSLPLSPKSNPPIKPIHIPETSPLIVYSWPCQHEEQIGADECSNSINANRNMVITSSLGDPGWPCPVCSMAGAQATTQATVATN